MKRSSIAPTKNLNQQNAKCTTVRKWRKHYVPSMNFVHLDDVQMQLLINAVSQSINQSSRKTVDELSKVLVKEKAQRNDFFSLLVKVVLFATFFCFGVLIIGATILKWNDLWIGGLQNLAVVILLIYSIVFIVLSVDIWFEKERNYLISIFSALVAFVALVITLFK